MGIYQIKYIYMVPKYASLSKTIDFKLKSKHAQVLHSHTESDTIIYIT